jgi:hypothetical protein
MTLNSAHFIDHNTLTAFINTQAIDKTNILKIDADSVNGGWVIWWWT